MRLCLTRGKREIEMHLRSKFNGFSRGDFLALPIMADYERYYKSFEKTYHVQLQLESIVLKGKSLPNVSPLVDSNFVAEIETLVLTAGHDAVKLKEPIMIDISTDGDLITQMNGTTRSMRAGDMIMRDGEGVCCSIIYGQDNRSPISKDTTHALYVAYAPPGVGTVAVENQLDGILANIKLFSYSKTVDSGRGITKRWTGYGALYYRAATGSEHGPVPVIAVVICLSHILETLCADI